MTHPSLRGALGVPWLLPVAAPRGVVYSAARSVSVELITVTLSRVEPHQRRESSPVDSVRLPLVRVSIVSPQELLRGYTSSSGPSGVYIEISGSCARLVYAAAPHTVQSIPEESLYRDLWMLHRCCEVSGTVRLAPTGAILSDQQVSPNVPKEGEVKFALALGQFPVVYASLNAHIICAVGCVCTTTFWLGKIQYCHFNPNRIQDSIVELARHMFNVQRIPNMMHGMLVRA